MKIGQKIISAEEHLGKYVKTRRENIVIPQKVKTAGNAAGDAIALILINTFIPVFMAGQELIVKIVSSTAEHANRIMGNIERAEDIKDRWKRANIIFSQRNFFWGLGCEKSCFFWTADIRELAQAAGNSIKKVLKR